MNPLSPSSPLGDSDPDADTPRDLVAPAARDLPQRLLELLARDPQVVWTPAGLVAASGSSPGAAAAALRDLIADGQAFDAAPKGNPMRVRYAGAVREPILATDSADVVGNVERDIDEPSGWSGGAAPGSAASPVAVSGDD